MAREITADEKELASGLLTKARAAMQAVEDYDQAAVDRMCRAVAWASGNEDAAIRLVRSLSQADFGTNAPKIDDDGTVTPK